MASERSTPRPSFSPPGAVPVPRELLQLPTAAGDGVVRWLLRVGVALGLAFGIGFLPYLAYQRSGLSRALFLNEQLEQIQRDNQRLRRENRRLLLELDRLKEDDDHAIERVARDELGLIRPGELVFKVEGSEGPEVVAEPGQRR